MQRVEGRGEGRSSADRRWRWLAAGAAAAYFLLTLEAARLETPTVDEFAHLPAGCAVLAHGRLDLYAKNPPLARILMAVPVMAAGAEVPPLPPGLDPLGSGPWDYGYRFMVANAADYLDLFFLARLVPVLCGLFTGLLLFRWLRDLFSEGTAAVATSLFLLCPTVLAHSHLATLDAACMLAFLLTMMSLRWACRRRGQWRFAAAGAVWGIALLVKFTALLLAPVLVTLVAVHRRPRWRRAAGEIALVVAVALLVVNAGMGFSGTLRPLAHFELHSASGRALQGALPGWLPVPLPGDYVRGFDAQKKDTEEGEFGSYLLGEWSAEGCWYYDLVAFAVKVPLPFLLLLVAAPWTWRRSPLRSEERWAILLPAAAFLPFVALNRLDIGVRYLLPLFPFLYLAVAPLWRDLSRPWAKALGIAAIVYYAAIAASIRPAFLSYFNPLAGGPANGHRVLLDSNLDWGQDLYRLPSALEELHYSGRLDLLYFGHVHPALYGIDYRLVPPFPVEGVLAVSVNYLMGYPYPATGPEGRAVPVEPGHLAWLRSREATARAGTIWIFDTRRPGAGTPPRRPEER